MPVNLKVTFPVRTTSDRISGAQSSRNCGRSQKDAQPDGRLVQLDVPNCDLTVGLWASNSIPPHSFLCELELENDDLTAGLWAANSIPPHSFLRELENDCAQKWLNAAKSILDSSNNTLRLPLFSLPQNYLDDLLGLYSCTVEAEEDEEDEEDYPEPEGTSSKRRKPKPPQCTSERQKEFTAETQKVQRKKKKEDGRKESDREGDGNGGEGSQREQIVDSIPLERENMLAAGKNPLFWISPSKIKEM
ncbi:hypothetical protein DFH08DRAFT_825905 [Mycena albidolilacea]|uniref:Uncharacterized protein n=1 Tax=Mycena albidolilacea TaxID=1033008 RepID=A0AAD7E9Q0_9AGAR|nr:hypothetical protein DFH08DRAFT_825905 [Mycena albidolilacea]